MNLDTALDRASTTPAYAQVKARLREAIRDGRLTGQLPAERQLAELFGVSYMTARKAVTDLVDEGLLLREHGRGTFVRTDTPAPKILHIGIVIPPPVRHGAANPYFSRVIQGVADEARRHGFRHTVMASSCADFIGPTSDEDPRLTAQVAGIVALAMSEGDYPAAHEARRHVPVVAVDSAHHEDRIPNFLCDNRAGSRLATEHLVRLGHRRIACITGSMPSQVTQERLEGYREALAAAGLAYDPALVVTGDYEFESGYSAAGRLFLTATPPTGLVCGNDVMAFGAYRKLQEMGRRIPEDVSVVGFDDVLAASYLTPGLTTIAVPKEDLGWMAIQALLAAISERPFPSQRVLPVSLVVRQSTSHPPRSG
jgi:DNA-binding LacI/PurR family transcriptional regulator